MHFRRNREAHSLTETLFVAAIVGMMAAVMLPAIQAVIASSRGMTCRNNLRQLATALNNYHDTWGNFPPSRGPIPYDNAISENAGGGQTELGDSHVAIYGRTGPV